MNIEDFDDGFFGDDELEGLEELDREMKRREIEEYYNRKKPKVAS